MLILKSTTDKLQIVTGSAVTTIAVLTSYADYDPAQAVNDRVTVDRKITAITTAATTDVVLAPGTGIARNVKGFNVRNTHASSSNLITIQHTDGTTTTQLFAYTLLAGEEIQYADEGWIVVDATGAIKYTNVTSLASQADMESGTSLTVAVTPGRQHFHPGHPKFWIKSIVTTNVPALTVSYNVTSITDTATGQLTVTIATDFSSANWCCVVSGERAATALAVTDARDVNVRFGGQAAGTVLLECNDKTATTMAIKDPGSWHAAGLGDHA